jgi:hypothetical protein
MPEGLRLATNVTFTGEPFRGFGRSMGQVDGSFANGVLPQFFQEIEMNVSRTGFFKWAAAAAVAAGALFTASSASAQVSWSLGVSVPGVAVGVAAPPPAYYGPPPAYYVAPPAPVYYRPPPPVYYRPPPPAVVYEPAPVYYGPGPYYYRHHHHWR